MKWELVTLGLGWGYFLFKLYQQYRQCKHLYQNPYIQQQTTPSPPSKILYDSQTQSPSTNIVLTEQNMPDSSKQVQKMEGNPNQQLSQSFKKHSITLDTTIDQTQFVIFPQLYPQLKKKKSIAKRTYLGKLGKQKSKFNIKRKRDTRKYKEWFITNKALFEIQQSGQFTSQQMEQHYEKFTRQIKSTVLEGHQSASDSVKSQQGMQFGQRYKFRAEINEQKQSKFLGFLEEQGQMETQSYKIAKYDPFE